MECIVKWNEYGIRLACEEDMDIWEQIPPYYQLVNGQNTTFSKSIVVQVGESPEIIWSEESILYLKVRNLTKEVNRAIIILLNVLFKRILQEEGKYILHASSVIINKRAVMLWGSSGSGKTATAMSLASNSGVAFLSNGSTVVRYDGESVKVLGSFKDGIKIRKSTLKQLDVSLAERIFVQQDNQLGFDEKKVLLPESFGYRSAKKEAIEAVQETELYIIHLNRRSMQVSLKAEYDYKTAMLIYEDLIREISGAEVYISIDGEQVYVPSFDNEKISLTRTNFINYLMEHHYKGMLMGKLEDVRKLILE